jgi:DNA-binding NarL/FixJ family response regulator
MCPYRILIADDHPLYRDALCNVVLDAFPGAQVTECEDFASALTQLATATVDLVVLDLTMPGVERLDGVRQLRAAHPAVPVIVCSAHDDPGLVREAFRLGVAGYLPKSSGLAIAKHALQLVRGGGVYVPSEALGEAVPAVVPVAPEQEDSTALTPRQAAVLALLQQGMSNKAIARELDIGEITVKAHVSAILRKLGVDNRLQAVVAARELRR